MLILFLLLPSFSRISQVDQNSEENYDQWTSNTPPLSLYHQTPSAPPLEQIMNYPTSHTQQQPSVPCQKEEKIPMGQYSNKRSVISNILNISAASIVGSSSSSSKNKSNNKCLVSEYIAGRTQGKLGILGKAKQIGGAITKSPAKNQQSQQASYAQRH